MEAVETEERVTIENDSVELLQTLDRIMRLHPSHWDQSAIQGVLAELKELEAEGVPDNILDVAQRVRDVLLEPVLDILLKQENLMNEERQNSAEKELELSSEILLLLEERNKAIQQFQEESKRRAKQKKFSESLLRDLDEMVQALDKSRQAARQSKRLLIAKEAELQNLLGEKRDLLKLIIEGGPWALWDWIRKEIVEQGLEPGEDFERRWLRWLAANGKMINVEGSPSVVRANHKTDDGTQMAQYVPHQDTKDSNYWSTKKDEAGEANLLWIILTIVLQEGVGNLQYVIEKGLFFLPMAWFYFWIGMSSRITRCVTGDIMYRLKRSPFAFALDFI